MFAPGYYPGRFTRPKFLTGDVLASALLRPGRRLKGDPKKEHVVLFGWHKLGWAFAKIAPAMKPPRLRRPSGHAFAASRRYGACLR